MCYLHLNKLVIGQYFKLNIISKVKITVNNSFFTDKLSFKCGYFILETLIHQDIMALLSNSHLIYNI